MDIHNLSTVMTPNILYPNAKNSTVDESFLAIEAVNALITYNDTMCEVSTLHPDPVGSMLIVDRFRRICSPSSVIRLCSGRMPK